MSLTRGICLLNYSMNLYNRYLSDLSQLTGIKATIMNIIPEDISAHLYKLLQTKSAAGWYDNKKDCVCLYEPNLIPEESDIKSKAVFLYVREKGLKSLIKDRFPEFCSDIVSEFYHGTKQMNDNRQLEKMAMDYISEIPIRDTKRWGKIATLICRYSLLDKDIKIVHSLINAHHAYIKKVQWEARMNNDHNIVDYTVKEVLGNLKNDKPEALFGRCSDPFLSVGYPETELCIRSERVRLFLDENSLLKESSPNLAELIHNPLAIIKGEQKPYDEKMPLNIVVTDYFEPGKGYLSFGIDSAEHILAGYIEKSPKVYIRSARFMSDYALIIALSSNLGDNIKYLKPGKTHGYKISLYLKQMDGKSYSELGKKGGDGTTPVLSPLSESRRLIIATNIVNDFKNPMASDVRKKLFGGILFEDNLRKRQSIKEEINSMSQKLVTGYNTPKTDRTCKTRNARSVYFTNKDFSSSVLKKLNKKGLYSAFCIMTYGKERFAAEFGTRAFKDAVSFLDSNNLSFMNHSVIKKIDESFFYSKDLDGRKNIVQKDMHSALSALTQESILKSVYFPRRINGSYIQGAGAYSLIAKSMQMARWRDCNIFITRDQALEADIGINSTAIPTYIAENGDVTPYYNLSETTFALEKTESFARLKEDSQKSTPLVDIYAKRYISMLSAPANTDYDLTLIDAAFIRYYSQQKVLINNGSFKSHIMTSYQQQLEESYNTGFMKGKAEGINMMFCREEKSAKKKNNILESQERKSKVSGPKLK